MPNENLVQTQISSSPKPVPTTRSTRPLLEFFFVVKNLSEDIHIYITKCVVKTTIKP